MMVRTASIYTDQACKSISTCQVIVLVPNVRNIEGRPEGTMVGASRMPSMASKSQGNAERELGKEPRKQVADHLPHQEQAAPKSKNEILNHATAASPENRPRLSRVNGPVLGPEPAACCKCVSSQLRSEVSS